MNTLNSRGLPSQICLASLVSGACLMLAGHCLAQSLFTLAWRSPTSYTNGSPIPPGTITGYRVYNKTAAGYSLYSNPTTTTIQVPAGTYAVAAVFPDGQTGLGDPVTLPNWESELERPSASNTVSPADGRVAIQAKINALTAGGVLYFHGGNYNYTDASTSGTTFLTVGVSGAAGKYITLRNFPNEEPVIVGVGWTDNKVGPVGGVRQDLLVISGDYVRVFGLKVRDSARLGISINGSHCWIEECEFYDNWSTGLCYGMDSVPGRDVNNGTIIYCKVHHSRVLSGIFLNCDARENYNVDGWTIRRCLSYRNGYNDNNRINESGGGNADGFEFSMSAHDDYESTFNWVAPGRANRVEDLHVVECLSFMNADDGFDYSSGEGTTFLGNISARNGPSGCVGFKGFRNHFETNSFLGNTALGFVGNSFRDDTLYIMALTTTAIVAGDTITGVSSGATAQVSSGYLFRGGNVDSGQVWSNGSSGVLYLTNVSGVFRAQENIAVGGTNLATVTVLGQEDGHEGRANTTNAARPYGRNNEIAWTTLFHNPPGEGSLRGLATTTAISRGGDAINNLSHFNKGYDIFNNFTERNNFTNTTPGDPGILTPGYVFAEPTPQIGTTIRQQWRNIYQNVQANLMPVKGGNLYGAGTLNLNYYQSTPADDPANPSDPENDTKLQWFRSGKVSAAPDIGAVQYQAMFPPEIVLESTAPKVSQPVPDPPKYSKPGDSLHPQ